MKIKKLLFVEPPRHYWFIMGEYLPPPAVLLILAAYIERELPHLSIEILDCQAKQLNWHQLEKHIENTQPDMVLTSGFTCNTYSCARTAELTKKINPNIITVVGGIHFSFTPDESLQNYPEIDIIVRGEGEQTLINLIKQLNNNKPLNQINGISFRHNNHIIHTQPQPPIPNLDSLPFPAYHLIEDTITKYHFTMMAGPKTPYMILEGARGCEYQCTFCTQWNYWGGIWRTKSPKRIANEIEHLHNQYGSVFIWFSDDHINLKKRGKLLYNELKTKNCTDDIMLFFQARTDDVTHNPDLIHNLRTIGTYWIMCGVEHHLPETLKEYKKQTKNQDAYNSIKILRDNDIFSHAMFVIGNRKDTHETIDQLRHFSTDINPDFAIYTVLTPFPGTIYYQKAKQNGWIQDTNYTNYDMAHAIMPTETLTRQQVQEELWKCYRHFWGSPRKNLKGLFAKNILKRTLYRHMAGQHVLAKLRRLI